MPTRSNQQVQRTRAIILGSVAVVIVAVIAYGAYYSLSGPSGSGVAADEHYTLIENPPRRRAGEDIVVHEYFSYACVHCSNFEPLVHAWSEDLPDGVRLVRSPALFDALWGLLAQSYYALEQLGALEANHDRLFRAIHDNGRVFRSAEMVADFVDGNGTTAEEFLAAFTSPDVVRATRDADRRMRDVGINSVPSLVVAEKYKINMNVGRRASLDVADQLIAMELAGAESPEADGAGAPR